MICRQSIKAFLANPSTLCSAECLALSKAQLHPDLVTMGCWARPALCWANPGNPAGSALSLLTCSVTRAVTPMAEAHT